MKTCHTIQASHTCVMNGKKLESKIHVKKVEQKNALKTQHMIYLAVQNSSIGDLVTD